MRGWILAVVAAVAFTAGILVLRGRGDAALYGGIAAATIVVEFVKERWRP